MCAKFCALSRARASYHFDPGQPRAIESKVVKAMCVCDRRAHTFTTDAHTFAFGKLNCVCELRVHICKTINKLSCDIYARVVGRTAPQMPHTAIRLRGMCWLCACWYAARMSG